MTKNDQLLQHTISSVGSVGPL